MDLESRTVDLKSLQAVTSLSLSKLSPGSLSPSILLVSMLVSVFHLLSKQ